MLQTLARQLRHIPTVSKMSSVDTGYNTNQPHCTIRRSAGSDKTCLNVKKRQRQLVTTMRTRWTVHHQ